ncbi:MAG TPA: hypothetical protein VGF32_12965 [Streptosporangiaceae bacterium]|jgi:hypothetical protein
MHPDIVQSLAAERVRDMRKLVTATRRGGLARRVRARRAVIAHSGRRLGQS